MDFWLSTLDTKNRCPWSSRRLLQHDGKYHFGASRYSRTHGKSGVSVHRSLHFDPVPPGGYMVPNLHPRGQHYDLRTPDEARYQRNPLKRTTFEQGLAILSFDTEQIWGHMDMLNE